MMLSGRPLVVPRSQNLIMYIVCMIMVMKIGGVAEVVVIRINSRQIRGGRRRRMILVVHYQVLNFVAYWLTHS